MTDLERLAACIAIAAPLRQGRYSVSCAVSWELIKEVRNALEKAGVDWRELKKRAEAIEAERKDRERKASIYR
jgi:hypothetical protein